MRGATCQAANSYEAVKLSTIYRYDVFRVEQSLMRYLARYLPCITSAIRPPRRSHSVNLSAAWSSWASSVIAREM